jgi:nucleotide-binding universal stress UspA family protein
MRYVVGYDGSAASKAAVAFTIHLAQVTGAEVVAANVYEIVSPMIVRGSGAAATEMLQEDVRRLAERCVSEIGEPTVRRVAIAAESPAKGLHDIAEQEDADLLAVGVTHRGPVRRIVPGSVGDRLLHAAPCPVLVVPDHAAPPPRLVAAAYDDRPEADAALEVAARLAGDLGARLILLGVVEPSPVAPPAISKLWRELCRVRGERLEEVAAGLRDTGLDTTSRLLVGRAEDEIVRAIGTDIGLLVAGSRGYGPVRGVLAGSVSRHLVDHAPCPMVVVPRSLRESDRGLDAAPAEATAS